MLYRITPNLPSIGDEHMRALGFGLAGAHRTGKTTIARKLAELNKCPFITMSGGKLASDMGLKIGLDMAWSDRVRFQDTWLDLMLDGYQREGEGCLFVTDRTPIDLAAYVITAWHPAVTTKDEEDWAMDYVQRCMIATNAWLFQIGILQPGIPWVDDAQKGEKNEFYREALNSVMIGLAWGDSIKAPVHIVDRETLDMDERIAELTQAYSSNLSDYSRANTDVYPIQ